MAGLSVAQKRLSSNDNNSITPSHVSGARLRVVGWFAYNTARILFIFNTLFEISPLAIDIDLNENLRGTEVGLVHLGEVPNS